MTRETSSAAGPLVISGVPIYALASSKDKLGDSFAKSDKSAGVVQTEAMKNPSVESSDANQKPYNALKRQLTEKQNCKPSRKISKAKATIAAVQQLLRKSNRKRKEKNHLLETEEVERGVF